MSKEMVFSNTPEETLLAIARVHGVSFPDEPHRQRPHYQIVFNSQEERLTKFLAVVFDEPGYVSVVPLTRAARHDLQQGYRGDIFEELLRLWISEFEQQLPAKAN